MLKPMIGIVGSLLSFNVFAADSVLEVVAATPGDRQYETYVSTNSEGIQFDTTLRGSYCGSCQETLSQDVSCTSKFSVDRSTLINQLTTSSPGDIINSQLQVLETTILEDKESPEACTQYRLGFEDIPVALYSQGPACALPYEDYDDMFVTVVVCTSEKKSEPLVNLEVKDWFGRQLESQGESILEQPKCGTERSAIYGAYLTGPGGAVFEASQGIQWKIYQDPKDPIYYSHYSDDPNGWVNLPETGHWLLKTSENQDNPYIEDCDGHRSCFLALPCMYSMRGIVTVEAELANGTVLRKRFDEANGIWENRRPSRL